MRCNLCGKEFEVGNREDGIPNGVSFMTKQGMLTVCADCIIDMGKEAERKTEPQKDCKKCKNYEKCKNNKWKCCVYQPIEDEPQTDCGWK